MLVSPGFILSTSGESQLSKLIPENLMKKESDLINGFAPEVAWVTMGGAKKLDERMCIRPTSETIIWNTYRNWISSYRDLPILCNQWANVMRWEMRTRMFLRTAEFLWQEGHTAHATREEAEAEAVKMLNVWTTPGQVTDVPAYGEAIQFDTHLVENASFLRLKKLTVQYALPTALTKKASIDRVNVFFVGRNLWTCTKFSGYDPEPDRNLVRFNYPNTKQFVFGVEVTF